MRVKSVLKYDSMKIMDIHWTCSHNRSTLLIHIWIVQNAFNDLREC